MSRRRLLSVLCVLYVSVFTYAKKISKLIIKDSKEGETNLISQQFTSKRISHQLKGLQLSSQQTLRDLLDSFWSDSKSVSLLIVASIFAFITFSLCAYLVSSYKVDLNGDYEPKNEIERLMSKDEKGLVKVTMGNKGSNQRDSFPQERFQNVNWHSMEEEEIYRLLQTRRNGLSSTEHETLFDIYGPNILTPRHKIHWFVKFLWNLVAPFQLFLIVAAVLCFVAFGIDPKDKQILVLACMLIFVVLLTTIFQSYQEGKSDSLMEELKKLAPLSGLVYQDGDLITLPASELVPGDIVQVNGGDKVPADLRIISGNLKINNASLTGENAEIRLSSDVSNVKEISEAKNIARTGCYFSEGSGLGVVISTGDATLLGSIATSAASSERPETLLKKELRRFILIMAIIACSLGVLFLILSIVSGYELIDAVLFCITIIVANIPEGLPVQITVALTLTAQRMFKSGVLVNNLEVIETLGAVDVICTDKTGTLTCNQMTVSHLVYDKKITSNASIARIDGDDFEHYEKNSQSFKYLQRNAILNSEATFLTNGTDITLRDMKGDATECALIRFSEKEMNVNEFRSSNPRIFSIPFNSRNKYKVSIHEIDGSPETLLVMMKGAPDKVLTFCNTTLINGEMIELTPQIRRDFEELNLILARRGERVLAFAQLEIQRSDFPVNYNFTADLVPNFPFRDFSLTGLISLIDPPRESVKAALKECKSAGVKVIMVTGDHPITAHYIGKSLNLITKPTREELISAGIPIPEDYHDAIVVNGAELKNFTELDWMHVLKHDEIIFARTLPQQKQDIVKELHKGNHVVAMTGDGVNDGPALKSANVGVAMGSGSSVAKEAAQIVLLNDDFGGIVLGIKEGRLIFDNLKKAIAYVLSSNVPELVPFLLFILLKIPLGIETLCVLLIDVGTDIPPTISLAYEGSEESIMNLPPRRHNSHLVGFKLIAIGI